MALTDSLERIYVAIRLYISVLILNVQLFVRQQIEYRTAPAKSASRTVLIMGDGVARGVGDSFGHCGLASRLPAIVRSRQDDTSLRLHWHAVTAGKLHSKASDWMPGAKSKLFENALIRGPFKAADVVVVVLGVHDDLLENGQGVVNAISRIAEGVVRLGKHVIVSSLPNEHPHKSEEHARVRELNANLRREMKKIQEQNNGPRNGRVSFEVEMEKVYAMGNDVLAFQNDFIALNGNGYRLLTNEVFDAFVPAAKKVEWIHWRQKLSGQ